MKIENFFDFCSGIGGGRLGLENAELKSVGYSDTSRLSVLTYKQLFNTENEKNFGSITIVLHVVLLGGLWNKQHIKR